MNKAALISIEIVRQLMDAERAIQEFLPRFDFEDFYREMRTSHLQSELGLAKVQNLCNLMPQMYQKNIDPKRNCVLN